jgi:hypothetical protein
MEIKNGPENPQKLYCEICNYNASYYKDLLKHYSTRKHKHRKEEMKNCEMEMKNCEISPLFYCRVCNYKTSNKNHFNSHNNTSKHKKNSNEENNTLSNCICKNCNKQFISSSGLWKHSRKCTSQINIDIENESIDNNREHDDITSQNNNTISNEMVLEILRNNKELQNILITQNKELQDSLISQNKLHQQQIIEMSQKQSSVITTNSHNTTNNNQFNLNFFLNETCKDAMNITDFVNSLKIDTSDFENTGRLGYVEGISRIIINGLKDVDVEKRPIHCTDLKRETVYIKHDNTW